MLMQHACRQAEGTVKRWFSDTDHDLFVWLNTQGNITAFQYSYNKLTDEHLISWSLQYGYSHNRIDDGEDVTLQIKMSPIMVPDGVADGVLLANSFRRISKTVEPNLVEFIYAKLLAYKSKNSRI